MEKDTQNEIIVAVVLIILILLFLNPFGLFMPDMLVYMMIAGVVVLFALFAGFVWKEKVRDEREQLHKMIAGRLATALHSSPGQFYDDDARQMSATLLKLLLAANPHVLRGNHATDMPYLRLAYGGEGPEPRWLTVFRNRS